MQASALAFFQTICLKMQLMSRVKRNNASYVMQPGCQWQMASFEQFSPVRFCKQFAEMIVHACAEEHDVLTASLVQLGC